MAKPRSADFRLFSPLPACLACCFFASSFLPLRAASRPQPFTFAPFALRLRAFPLSLCLLTPFPTSPRPSLLAVAPLQNRQTDVAARFAGARCRLFGPWRPSVPATAAHIPLPPPMALAAAQTTSPHIFFFFIFFIFHSSAFLFFLFFSVPFVVLLSVLYFPLFARFSSIFRVLLSSMIVSQSVDVICA